MRCATLGVLLIVAGSACAQELKGARHALLVGCTRYPNHASMRTLYGPANDVPLWARVLTDPKGFAFPAANVKQLVGWPDAEEKRPTHANLVKAFEDLVAVAAPDTQIVIVLAGHG